MPPSSAAYSTDPEILFQQALHRQQHGDLAAAARLYLQLLRAAKLPQAWYNLGTVRNRQHKAAAAISCYRQALRLAPDHAEAAANLGTTFHALGDPAQGAYWYRKALQQNPLDPDILTALGDANTEMGLVDEAGRCFSLALQLDADHGPAHAGIAMIHYLQHERQPAATAFARAIACGADTPTNRHLLAALQGEPITTAATAYARELFDQYAATFDDSLTAIGYRVPRLLRKALPGVIDSPLRFRHALDLGCGTGLSGEPFRPLSDRLTGVDLSSPMLDQAAAKDLYDELIQEDCLTYLAATRDRYDLFLLTDVLVYLGDPEPILAAISRRALDDALLLFSIETCGPVSRSCHLQPSGRFAHCPETMRRLAAPYGFTILLEEEIALRREKENWIPGTIYIWRHTTTTHE